MMLAGHLECRNESSGVYRVLWGNLRGRDHLENPGVDGRIILIWIFRKSYLKAWTRLVWPRIETGTWHF
jgi:hypothetical protein